MVQFAEYPEETRLIYQGGITVRNMDLEILVTTAPVALVETIKRYLSEFVS